MGWAYGSELLEMVARTTMPYIPEGDRPSVARELIDAFEDRDCDTVYEVDQEDIHRAYLLMYPGEIIPEANVEDAEEDEGDDA